METIEEKTLRLHRSAIDNPAPRNTLTNYKSNAILVRLVELAIAEEREACAKIADDVGRDGLAELIRARNEERQIKN